MKKLAAQDQEENRQRVVDDSLKQYGAAWDELKFRVTNTLSAGGAGEDNPEAKMEVWSDVHDMLQEIEGEVLAGDDHQSPEPEPDDDGAPGEWVYSTPATAEQVRELQEQRGGYVAKTHVEMEKLMSEHFDRVGVDRNPDGPGAEYVWEDMHGETIVLASGGDGDFVIV